MRFIAVFLAAWLAAPLQTALAQQALNLVVVEGDGAINNIRQRTAREPIVRVEDENHKPIAGAAVVFLLPSQGAGGAFAGGAQTLTVMTNNQGLAAARGLRPNGVQGQYQIRVNASFQGQTASTTISQTNALAGALAGGAAAAGISAKLIAIIAVVGGAAVAGGVVAATRGGSSSTPTVTPTTITAGASTVGPPH